MVEWGMRVEEELTKTMSWRELKRNEESNEREEDETKIQRTKAYVTDFELG